MPNWAWGWLKLGIAKALEGDCTSGHACTAKANELVNGWGSELIQAYIGVTFAHCGDMEQATKAYQRMSSHADSVGVSSPFAFMAISAGLKKQDEVLEWAHRGVQERSVACYAMRTIPTLDIYPTEIFNNPEFQAIVESLNFPDK